MRGKVVGTPERPRLTVFRSSKHIYAQLIDDLTGVTLAAASSRGKEAGMPYGGNIKAAQVVGKKLAEVAKGKGILKAPSTADIIGIMAASRRWPTLLAKAAYNFKGLKRERG